MSDLYEAREQRRDIRRRRRSRKFGHVEHCSRALLGDFSPTITPDALLLASDDCVCTQKGLHYHCKACGRTVA